MQEHAVVLIVVVGNQTHVQSGCKCTRLHVSKLVESRYFFREHCFFYFSMSTKRQNAAQTFRPCGDDLCFREPQLLGYSASSNMWADLSNASLQSQSCKSVGDDSALSGYSFRASVYFAFMNSLFKTRLLPKRALYEYPALSCDCRGRQSFCEKLMCETDRKR